MPRWRAIPALLRRPPIRIALLVAFALLFLGSRGIWDPDEGRYTNVAINMVQSGDWIVPHRDDDVAHWTKPPLTYWMVGASLATFGRSAWAARLPIALAYVACTLLAWRIARRLSPGSEIVAATMYATMLLPWIASQLVTTDFLLSMFEGMAMAAYVEGRWGDRHPRRWFLLMWVALALAFLTKGPPALLPLPGILAAESVLPDSRRVFSPAGLCLFIALAGSWYVAAIVRTPGLLDYLIGSEVVGRVASNRFGRHGQWYGWLVVYAPALLIGTLPWTRAVLRAIAAQVRCLPAWRHAQARRADARHILLAAWWFLPVVVFCLARSRLPLYVLPVFLPLAVAAAAAFVQEGRRLRPWRLALWCVGLVLVRIAAAHVPTSQDARAWAEALRERVPTTIDEVVFVEATPRYGLRLELGAEVETIGLQPVAIGAINPPFDEDLATELHESAGDPHEVWVARQVHWADIDRRLRQQGFAPVVRGAPWRGHIVFQLQP